MIVDIGALAAWIAALGVIGGVVVSAVKFMQKINCMDKKLDNIMVEQKHIAKGTLASLKGLKQQGSNGPVMEALEELEKHIFEQAHE